MIVLKRILVATDFGEASDAAVRYGRELATNFGATLRLLHVTDNLYQHAGVGLEGFSGIGPEAQEDIERAARKETEAQLTAEDRQLLGAVAVVITSGRPAATIVEYAMKEHIDLIVLGTHGRGAIGHMFMGSVAERVVRTAPCPVLTLRHPEHEFVLPDALVATARNTISM